MQKELIQVFRDKHKQEITTFVSLQGHGARIDLDDFINMLVEEYGNPASTLTRKALLEKLGAASARVIHRMKEKTAAVAAINLESHLDDKNQSHLDRP